jgi:hypothetical protein
MIHESKEKASNSVNWQRPLSFHAGGLGVGAGPDLPSHLSFQETFPMSSHHQTSPYGSNTFAAQPGLSFAQPYSSLRHGGARNGSALSHSHSWESVPGLSNSFSSRSDASGSETAGLGTSIRNPQGTFIERDDLTNGMGQSSFHETMTMTTPSRSKGKEVMREVDSASAMHGSFDATSFQEQLGTSYDPVTNQVPSRSAYEMKNNLDELPALETEFVMREPYDPDAHLYNYNQDPSSIEYMMGIYERR